MNILFDEILLLFLSLRIFIVASLHVLTTGTDYNITSFFFLLRMFFPLLTASQHRVTQYRQPDNKNAIVWWYSTEMYLRNRGKGYELPLYGSKVKHKYIYIVNVMYMIWYIYIFCIYTRHTQSIRTESSVQ